MIREVDLVSYLPPFMQNYKETVAALEAENPEFAIIWKATDKVLYNHFISKADEYGLSRFEKLLGIFPTSDDTLESRRSRVQSKWFNTIPYTLTVLLQKLTVLCGDTSFVFTNNFKDGYTVTLITDLELYGQVEELEYIINTMMPENIDVDSRNNIPCCAEGSALFGGGICYINTFTITNDFIETYGIKGCTLVGGGMVQTDMVQVSTDFLEHHSSTGTAVFGGGTVQTGAVQISMDSIEQHTATGTAILGGGIVGTQKVTITQDFNESMRVDGNALTASGIVQVDFIEIKQN